MIFVLVILVAGGILGFEANKKTQLNATWATAAAELGLTARRATFSNGPEISGTIDGEHVLIKIRSGGNNSPGHTRYEVRHAPVGPPVKLSRQSGLTRVAKFLGKTDIEIGDPFFDDRVVVDSPTPEAIREFLTPARQAVVLEVFDRWKNGAIHQDRIVAETQGPEKSAAQLVATTRRLVDIAAVMADPERVNAALEKQLHGNFADALADLHQLNEERPNSFTETLEAEALIELGDHAAAVEVFDIVDSRLPETNQPDGWASIAAKPAPVSLPAPRVVEQVSLDQQTVIDDLFNAGRLSYEIVGHFEQAYANKTVKWNGIVTGVNNFRHDTDFGDGPGQKVNVLLGGSGRGTLISNEVHAVVQLDAAAHVQRDAKITFRGSIIRIDRFSRKLYVAGAALV